MQILKCMLTSAFERVAASSLSFSTPFSLRRTWDKDSTMFKTIYFIQNQGKLSMKIM